MQANYAFPYWMVHVTEKSQCHFVMIELQICSLNLYSEPHFTSHIDMNILIMEYATTYQ